LFQRGESGLKDWKHQAGVPLCARNVLKYGMIVATAVSVPLVPRVGEKRFNGGADGSVFCRSGEDRAQISNLFAIARWRVPQHEGLLDEVSSSGAGVGYPSM